MKKLLKYTEWQSCSGRWYCGATDLDILGSKTGALWFLPARFLGLSPAQYLQWVINNYEPDRVFYSKDFSFVGWSWSKENQLKMRKFKNKINLLAKEKGIYV